MYLVNNLLVMKKKLFALIVNIFVIIPVLLVGCAFGQQAEKGGGWSAESVWINTKKECLMGMWKWCFDYEKAVWIDEAQNPNISATSIVQDVIFAATYMVWTVLTLVIIYCWLMYIFASRWGQESKANTYKKWLISGAVWALLVWWAYTIVRLIQYVAHW